LIVKQAIIESVTGTNQY